jgi:hypothetical protein
VRTEGAPLRSALGEQPQQQAEEVDDEHGKVPGARPVIRGVLVCAAHRAGLGLVLRLVLLVADAFWRVADQVQGTEDPVAQEQRAHEQHG